MVDTFHEGLSAVVPLAATHGEVHVFDFFPLAIFVCGSQRVRTGVGCDGEAATAAGVKCATNAIARAVATGKSRRYIRPDYEFRAMLDRSK